MRLLALILLLAQSPSEELSEVARRGDLARARELLEAGVDVNAGNRYGATAVFFAAEKGNLEMVRLLVENGARVDLTDRFYEMTALTRALFGEHEDVVVYLLGAGAPQADVVLGSAAERDRVALARAALETKRVSREAYDGALEEATSNGRVELERLIESYPRPAAPASAAEDVATAELDSLAGVYQNDQRKETLTVGRDEGVLTLAGARSGRLEPLGERMFALSGTEVRVEFAGRGGMVERLVVHEGESAVAYRPFDEAESRAAAPTGEADVARATDAVGPAARGAARPWGAFRGENGGGAADGQGVPLAWSEREGRNIKFKTPIPGFSVASPIVWGGRIFVVTAVSGAGDDSFRTGLYGDVRPVDDLSEHRWLLYALSTADGSILWERELHHGVPSTKRHSKSSQANATPVSDGRHVVTVVAPAGFMYCHDVEGNLVWKTELGVRNVGWFYDPDYQWGHSSSPILYDDLVILQSDAHNDPHIAAYHLADGSLAWKTPRPENVPTFSTPAVYRGETGDELITNGIVVRGYDPKTGNELWHLGPNSEIPIGVPVISKELDLIYVTAGYPPIRPIYAIRPGSRGDLALPEGVERSEALAWSKDRGGTYIPSPLVYRGIFYTNANNGRLTAYDAVDGDRLYRARIGGVGGSYSASPIAADGRLYFTNEDGETYVVRAGEAYELLAHNDVDGTVLSTPAASDGLLVIRSLTHVYGISE